MEPEIEDAARDAIAIAIERYFRVVQDALVGIGAERHPQFIVALGGSTEARVGHVRVIVLVAVGRHADEILARLKIQPKQRVFAEVVVIAGDQVSDDPTVRVQNHLTIVVGAHLVECERRIEKARVVQSLGDGLGRELSGLLNLERIQVDVFLLRAIQQLAVHNVRRAGEHGLDTRVGGDFQTRRTFGKNVAGRQLESIAQAQHLADLSHGLLEVVSAEGVFPTLGVVHNRQRPAGQTERISGPRGHRGANGPHVACYDGDAEFGGLDELHAQVGFVKLEDLSRQLHLVGRDHVRQRIALRVETVVILEVVIDRRNVVGVVGVIAQDVLLELVVALPRLVGLPR